MIIWNSHYSMKKETFDLIFQFDGDYCDTYVDSIDTKFASFALVEQSFLKNSKN